MVGQTEKLYSRSPWVPLGRDWVVMGDRPHVPGELFLIQQK